MSLDNFLQLIETISSFDTQVFLRDLIHSVLFSPDRDAALYRFMVKGLTHCKDLHDSFSPEHEFMVIELTDTQRGTDPSSYFIILERTAGDGTHFMEPTGDSTVLESITRTLKRVPSSILASGSVSKSLPSKNLLSTYQPVPSDDLELIPLGSPSSPVSLSPHLAVTTDKVEVTPSPTAYRVPVFDRISFGSASAIHRSTQVSLKAYRADDRFVGSLNFPDYADMIHNIQQLRPQNLSLFDFAVLADTVHKHDPHYSKFKHQCYWFASIICDIVLKEYTCTSVGGAGKGIIPSTDYLPAQEGRWMSIMISSVEEEDLRVVTSEFNRYLQEKKDEVSLI